MKLLCLSSNPSKPCFVMYFKGVTMMFDCGLNISQLQHYIPLQVVPSAHISGLPVWRPSQETASSSTKHLGKELKECGGRIFVDGSLEFSVPEVSMVDMSQVDVIFISNHTCMLALPYITEYTSFRGIIYATDPTVQIGRLYMDELLHYVESCPRSNVATAWKQDDILKCLPPPLRDAVKPSQWRHLYSKHDVNACMARVHPVGFNEKLDIFGTLTVTASSSGFCLGSSNWIIQSQHEKISYVSGSSTLTTHPKPIEQAPLKNSDVLILTCLTQTPLANPDAMIGEFCVNAAMTLKNGGNVLVPCYPSGITYDLFECISAHLDSFGLNQVPLYFLSPVSDSTLAYSNIFAEWLSQSKQSKVYLPEPPFPHAELTAQGRLKNYSSIHDGLQNDFKTPCVVFAGHPSLRMGDVVHFVDLWCKSPSNTIIFTEPDFPYLDALGPYQPVAMKICYCPIDTSLSFSQANKLIKELRPLHLVVAESYITPPVLMPNRTDLVIEWDPSPLTYKRSEVMSLPVKRKFEQVEISPELAASLEPIEVKPGSAITIVTASMVVKDNKYLLEPLPKDFKPHRQISGGQSAMPRSYIWGKLNIHQFVEELATQGITDVKVEDIGSGHIIHLPKEETLIQIEPDSTHIICDGDEIIRLKIRDALLKCLSKF